MKAQFSAHPKQAESKKSTEKRQNGRQRSMEGKGEGGKMGGDLHGALGGRKPRFSLFSWGGEPPGPRAGEAGDIVGPPGLLYGASVMG